MKYKIKNVGIECDKKKKKTARIVDIRDTID